MLTRCWVSCAVVMLSVVGCGGKSAAERMADHDRARVSWEQTARFVGAEWIARAIPDAFAARTLARARDELQSEAEAVRKDELSAQERALLRDSLHAALAFGDSLARVVGAGDREAAAVLVSNSPRANADSLLRRASLR
jgi:hypothetical protein